MNRLLALLTLAGCGAVASVGAAGAVPLAAGLEHPTVPGWITVQLGNGGPVGGGPNGVVNGTGAAVGSGTFRGTAPSSTAGTGGVGANLPGRAISGGALPNGSNGRPNGSKPAPMRPNGVRKVQ